jgi:hypothetical protein
MLKRCEVCKIELARNNKKGLCEKHTKEKFKKEYIEKWLKEGNLYIERSPADTVREYILREQNGKCAICKALPSWNDKPLVFVLDHIDGHSKNHNRDNLRLICPNCDSQLPTFKSKNKGNGTLKEREYRKHRYHGR